MPPDADRVRRGWVPELGPKELRALSDICSALNASEEAIADMEVGLALAGVLEVVVDDMARMDGDDGAREQAAVGTIQAVDAAAWVFVPGDPTTRNRKRGWGAWQFMPWPEERILAVVEAARALVPPIPEGATRLTSLVVDGEEKVDPRREALRDALDALDKSAYVLCGRRQHVVRGDHVNKDGSGCDHRYIDDEDPSGCDGVPSAG